MSRSQGDPTSLFMANCWENKWFFFPNFCFLRVCLFPGRNIKGLLFVQGYVRCFGEQTEIPTHHPGLCKREQMFREEITPLISHVKQFKNDGSMSILSVREWAISDFYILHCITDCLFCWSNHNRETQHCLCYAAIYICITKQWNTTGISCGSGAYTPRFLFLTGGCTITVAITTCSFFPLRIY